MPLERAQPPSRSGLRFAQVTTFYPPHHFGGDALFVRSLACALARDGHQVDVLYAPEAYRALGGSDDGAASELASPSEPASTPGLTVHRLDSAAGVLSPLLTQQLGRPVLHRRSVRRLLGAGYDVIHYHNVSLVGGPGIFAYGEGIKLYTTHEHWLVCPTHLLWRHGRELCDRRQCLRCLLHYRRPPQLWRWTGHLGRLGRQVDAFCAPSRFTAQKHREFGFPFPMEVLPLFVPDSSDAPARPAVPGDPPPYFLFAGRLERIKGLEDVLPCFLGERPPAELWIAGTGSEEKSLKALAGGSPAVRFLGQVEPERMVSLYRGALGAVVPSLVYEVSPLVLLEAFRERVPVVARRLGSLAEIVEAAGGGLLFSTREELAGVLHRLAGSPAERLRLGERGRRSYEERWSEPAFLARYYELLERLARRRGRPRVNGWIDARRAATPSS